MQVLGDKCKFSILVVVVVLVDDSADIIVPVEILIMMRQTDFWVELLSKLP
jgi:hypothetical protein